MFSAFEHRNFRLLWIGRFSSNMGRMMRVFLRGWMVWQLTDSTLLMGVVISSLSWPMLFMPFVGGWLADKVDRRRLLKITESLLVVLWAVVAALVYFQLIVWWHFIISSVLSGIIQSIGRPTHQAILGSIVDKRRLANAVALDNIADSWPRVGGPLIGALLIGVIGTGWLFWMTSLGQLFTAITIFMLDWDPEEQRAKQRRQGHSGSFLEGFKYIWHEKVLLGLVSLGVVFAMIGGAAGFLMPIFADAILGVGASGLGLLMTAQTIGASIGAFLVLMLARFGRRGYLLMVVALLNSLIIIAFSRSEVLLISMVFVVGMGMGQVMFRTMRLVMLQTMTPDDLRGRVTSFQTVIQGLMWIGVLIMGSVAELLSRSGGLNLGFIRLGGDIASGTADTVLIGGILYGIVSLLFFMLFPALRRFR
ncbi:MAG: MFS transporter [Chloroflexi bacterium]|nr:MFS transporter [Chloroflexota bacterium]